MPNERKPRAKIVGVLLRLDTRQFPAWNLVCADVISGMSESLSQLHDVQKVIIETVELSESDGLAEKLVSLNTTGRVQRRTCQDGQKDAIAAMKDPHDLNDHAVVSSLIGSERHNMGKPEQWCATTFPCESHC